MPSFSAFECQLSSIAIKLSPLHPSLWPDWILASVTYFSGRGVATEYILDFLSIAAEEIDTADLIGPTKCAPIESFFVSLTVCYLEAE
jgi:hypothetical protein